MSTAGSARDEEASQLAAVTKMPALLLARVGSDSLRVRTRLIWSWCLCGGLVGIAGAVGLLRWLENGAGATSGYGGIGALLTWVFAGLLGAVLEANRGFEPLYSRVVAAPPCVSMVNAVNAGLVVIEARIVFGVEEAPFVRPPMVLEDSAGSRLYVPVLEEFESVRALRGGTLHGPMLGDQTNGVLYKTGEAVVFVGQVNGQPAEASTYRDGKSHGINAFVADLAWHVYKGATREEVVEALRRRETSRVPFVAGVMLMVASVALSMVAFFGG